MEGFNPTASCYLGCRSCRTWVPPPQKPTRRDPLVDAVGRTDNPCERPSRANRGCDPMPKFRRPKELPECNLNCYRQEQQDAKMREAYEEFEKFRKQYFPTPEPEVQQCEEQVPPEQQWFVKEVPCRTDIIAGYFNPDDNKTPAEKLKEACDMTYLACGPNLPMYPCRGVIHYPPIRWTNAAEEANPCCQPVCQGTKYCDPEFQQQQLEEIRQKEWEKKVAAEQAAMEEEYKRLSNSTVDPCCTYNQKLSLTPYCNCGCDYSS